MLSYVANARDGLAGNGCSTCCCEAGTVRPGETNKIAINYAEWVAPLGGRGLIVGTQFALENVTPSASAGAIGNLPPTNTDYSEAVVFNTPFTGSVATNAVDPEADPLTFAHMPLYGPTKGTLAFNANGSYTYTPALGSTGYDSFVFSTDDGNNAAVLKTVRLTVNPALPAPALPAPTIRPALFVSPSSVKVMRQHIEFAVAADPTLPVGSVYRLTIRQPAFDCDETFFNVFCIDLTVGKC